MMKPALVMPTGEDIRTIAGAKAPRQAVMSGGLGISGTIVYHYASMEEAFPDIDPGLEPYGNLVLVQLRQPKLRTAGGVLLTDENRQTEHYNTQVAKIMGVGPLAFHNRNDMTPWPEGAWCQIGDFVRVPRYQGERFAVPFTRPDFEIENGVRYEAIAKDECIFVLFKDLSLLGKFTADPLTVRTFAG